MRRRQTHLQRLRVQPWPICSSCTASKPIQGRLHTPHVQRLHTLRRPHAPPHPTQSSCHTLCCARVQLTCSDRTACRANPRAHGSTAMAVSNLRRLNLLPQRLHPPQGASLHLSALRLPAPLCPTPHSIHCSAQVQLTRSGYRPHPGPPLQPAQPADRGLPGAPAAAAAHSAAGGQRRPYAGPGRVQRYRSTRRARGRARRSRPTPVQGVGQAGGRTGVCDGLRAHGCCSFCKLCHSSTMLVYSTGVTATLAWH